MEKINFREFLEVNGVLLDYARAKLGPGFQGKELEVDKPRFWVSRAFDWMDNTPGYMEWAAVHDRWIAELREEVLTVEPGLPLCDRLGMMIFLAELEDVNEAGKH